MHLVELTVGVCGSIAIQLPFLCTPKLLQREVQHLSHHPFLRPWDPITVILSEQIRRKAGEYFKVKLLTLTVTFRLTTKSEFDHSKHAQIILSQTI